MGKGVDIERDGVDICCWDVLDVKDEDVDEADDIKGWGCVIDEGADDDDDDDDAILQIRDDDATSEGRLGSDEDIDDERLTQFARDVTFLLESALPPLMKGKFPPLDGFSSQIPELALTPSKLEGSSRGREFCFWTLFSIPLPSQFLL